MKRYVLMISIMILTLCVGGLAQQPAESKASAVGAIKGRVLNEVIPASEAKVYAAPSDRSEKGSGILKLLPGSNEELVISLQPVR